MAKEHDRWGSPEWLVALARTVMNGIDLDPCTEEQHQRVVQARFFLTEADDGTTAPWPGKSVFLNPPGGGSVLVKRFWARAREHVVGPVFWVGFNLAQLRYLDPSPLDSAAFCVLKSRMAFRDPGEGTVGKDGVLRKRDAPRYDNYLALTGAPGPATIQRFRESVYPHARVMLCNGQVFKPVI